MAGGAGALPPDYAVVLRRCLKRFNFWRIPPNWSAGDWLEEVKAIGTAAAWQAESEFDSSRGVPLSAFLYQRIMARVLTRYRQEWTYALPLASEIGEGLAELAHQAEAIFSSDALHESIRSALDALTSPDRQLVVRFFWQEHSESQIGRSFGISQSAVNRRKHTILRKLRSRLEVAGTTCCAMGTD